MALLLCPGWLAAQTAAGRLAGSVADATGAVIPDAQVTARHDGLGVELEAETNAAGAFRLAALPPGLYTVTVSAQGFRSTELTGVKVDAAAETALPPVELAVGEVRETVEVVAGAPAVQTTNAELTSTVTREQIENLPLIGRDPLSFMRLQAGVASGGAAPTTINGQRTSFSTVTLDGVNIQDNYIRSNALDFLPSRTLIDQVAELTVTTQNGNAAIAGGSSGVSFVTPSGGGEFHGNAYWHNRNDALAAASWFSNRQGLPEPDLNVNQAGASLGGPVLRNRLFFYANYEALRQKAESLTNTQILTESARQGVFRYTDLSGNVQQVNVLNMQGLGFDPAARRVLDSIPGPEAINNFDVGDSRRDALFNTGGYRFLTRSDGVRDAVTSRMDWAASGQDLVSLTYKFSRENNDRPGLGNGYHTDPVVKDFGHGNLLSLGWTATPSARLTNEARFGFNLAPGDFRTTEMLGDFLTSGYLFTNPTVNFLPQGRNTDTFNWSDNAAYSLGRHDLRFGAQAQQIRVETFDSAGTVPSVALLTDVESQYLLSTAFFPGGIASDALFTAQDLLATLAGIVGQATQSYNVRDRNSGFVPGQEFRRRYRFDSWGLYLQDNWDVARRVNLNLGLRWDYYGRIDEADGLMLTPVIDENGVIPTLLSDATLDFAGGAAGRPLWKPDRNNFAPNIGLAWDVFGDGSMAIRAGYSISYVTDEHLQAVDNAVNANDGLQNSPLLQNLDRFLSQGAPAVPAPELEIPRRVSQNQAIDPSAALFTVDPGLRAPYVQQWTFGLQRRLLGDTVLEARYVGNKGTKLLRAFDFNQVLLRENGFLEDFNRARANGFLALEALGRFEPEFNGALVGSRPLTFFPRLMDGGALGASTVQELIRTGQPGSLAELYIVNDFTDGRPVSFRRNQNALVGDLVTNYSSSTYHALQIEARRRASHGILWQANYSFSKVLTDSSGTQVRFDPFLDNAQPSLERARADFDLSHVFNANLVWELPLGRGMLREGWTAGSIWSWQSGAPLSVISGRGTVNRPGRSVQNTASTTLTKSELEDVLRFRMTDDGPFFVAASAINPQDGSGVTPDGGRAFAGQAFFHPGPGEVGTLQRRMFNGPSALAFDFSLMKKTQLSETQTLTFGARVENLLNHPTFFAGSQFLDDEQFGRITGTLTSPRRIELLLRWSF
jgi:hypothetical protein